MNISDVNYFKIHPAIGVARIANNDDYFEFYEAHARNFLPADEYMSGGGPNDPEPGKLRIKKQAVKFTVFAYDSNNEVLGTVEDLFPETEVKWTANVGNRKLYNYSEKRGGTTINSITAAASASGLSVSELNGIDPWDNTKKVNLGAITGEGVFIPAKGGVARENEGSKIDRYPASASGNLECSDTSCDGEISAVIIDNGNPVNQSIIPAWVVSAPSQHALTLTPTMAVEMADNFGLFDPTNANNNKDWLRTTKSLLGINGAIYDPTGLDVLMMTTMNGDYNPGMEVNIGDMSRIENGVNPEKFFYPRNSGHISSNEIRIEPKDTTNGTIPGQLTSGLCSTWQGDMMACLNWWTAENPSQAYGANGQKEIVIYQKNDPSRQMNDPEEINTEMDFRGIVGDSKEGANIKLEIIYDPNRP